VSRHCSMQAELAEMAETAIGDLKICQYMEPYIGERLEARVHRISRGGLEVFLVDHNITGFVPMRELGDRPRLKGASLTVQAGRKSLSFSEGYPIRVRVKDIDFIRLQVLLHLD